MKDVVWDWLGVQLAPYHVARETGSRCEWSLDKHKDDGRPEEEEKEEKEEEKEEEGG